MSKELLGFINDNGPDIAGVLFGGGEKLSNGVKHCEAVEFLGGVVFVPVSLRLTS